MTSNQIRQQFIDFFVQRHGHTFVPSSPVVPLDDPTLLFTNAGMNQFKPIFLGQEKRSYVRAANTQKCIRAGGKHNDLDDVGRSRRHHTFFEMLGNWSFGDYFKQGAIEFAWELLTEVWKLDPTRLHVTCYEGNPAAGIPRDDEAAQIWKKVAGLPDDHIHYFGKDNFWEMGETGPCGPCTEIYIDRTPEKTGGPDVNGDNPAVMEIWNLVFIQYNRDSAGKLTTLPAQHVDTGMGLERICQVIQGKNDNFATDLWTPIFDCISQISNLKYTGKFPRTNAADPVAEAADEQLRRDIAFRVVADHARCLTFALTDGATPSNEGRGYVLRRILRRAVRFGRQQLGLHEPFMHKIVPVIVDSMVGAFPELKKNPRRVSELIRDEEESFGRTLDRGIGLFNLAADQIKAVWSEKYYTDLEDEPRIGADNPLPDEYMFISQGDFRTIRQAGMMVLPGVVAFRLHDTYGFPIDLTRIMSEERGMSVDIEGYEKLMESAKELARGVKKAAESTVHDLPPYHLDVLHNNNIKLTDDSAKFQAAPIQANIKYIWDGRADDTTIVSVGEREIAIILDGTNFYAEMGGQVGDQGELKLGNNVFEITSTKVVAGFILHIGRVRGGMFRLGDAVTATVRDSRQRTEQNHTSTHIANWALRETLGDAVQQKGSLVDPEKLRFDFSHNKSMTDDELTKVETLVNDQISKKLPVYWEEAPQETALKIEGLRAVFGEKYPPLVRVVSIGVPVKDLLANPTNPEWRKYSIEFCGGTHLTNTSEAQTFCLTAEESVSKGIRRIVALTGEAAQKARHLASELDEKIKIANAAPDENLTTHITEIQKALSAGTLPLLARRRAQTAVNELQTRHKSWEKKSAAKSSLDVGTVGGLLFNAASDFAPGKLIIAEVPAATDDQLRSIIDWLKKKSPSHAILLASAGDQKVTFIAAVSDDLIAKGLKAGDWVKEAAKTAGGSGGGRPQMAQAGGKDPSKLAEALETARRFALDMLK